MIDQTLRENLDRPDLRAGLDVRIDKTLRAGLDHRIHQNLTRNGV